MTAKKLFSDLAEKLLAAWPSSRFSSVTSVVAVSGGSDSVALLRLLTNILPKPRDNLIVAHYNHCVRGRESDLDEQFVRELADSLRLTFVVDRPKDPDTSSSEESFRNLRYRFLDRVAHQSGARYVVTAHTADDQVETIVHHLFRGSGLRGLAGIPPFRPLGTDVVLARPCLAIQRAELRHWLVSIQQPWREDATNQTAIYRRNWLRNELLPLIRSHYPEVDAAILRAGSAAAAGVEQLTLLAERFSEQAFTWVNDAAGDKLWIQRCWDGPQNYFETAASPLLPSQTVGVIALSKAWDQRGWPRGMMTHQHWSTLWQMVESGQPKILNLPGNIRAETIDSGKVVVERQRSD